MRGVVGIIFGAVFGLLIAVIVVLKYAETFPRLGRVVERWLPPYGDDDASR
jgi:hypothetical protein